MNPANQLSRVLPSPEGPPEGHHSGAQAPRTILSALLAVVASLGWVGAQAEALVKRLDRLEVTTSKLTDLTGRLEERLDALRERDAPRGNGEE